MKVQALLPYQSYSRPRTIWIEEPGAPPKLRNFKEDSLVLNIDNCAVESMGPDEIPATEGDVIKCLRFAERFSEQEDVSVWSNYFELTLGFALGLECQQSRNVKEALVKTIRPYFSKTQVLIPNLWVVEVFDYCLGLGGDLITSVEDYMVTGILVTPKGEVLESLEVR
jgi:hypothetical protein